MIGANVGSGQRRFESTPEMQWINVDRVSRPGQVPDLIAEGDSIPIDEGSLDAVVLWHVCEHLGLGEADEMIREAHRMLRAGGQLIVAVPDIRSLAVRWLRGAIDDYIFLVNVYGAFQSEESDRHRWGFHQKSLLEWLKGASTWRKVEQWDGDKFPGMDTSLDWWMATARCVK